jgi:lysophospholipase L1-like esterase
MNNRKPRIYCFGCSFTQGVGHGDWVNYTTYLSELLPNYDVYNYGVGGSSELFHAYLMRTLPEKTSEDVTILQLTSIGRFTQWNDINYHTAFEQQTEDLWKLDRKIITQNVQCITYGMLDRKNYPDYKFIKMYYERTTRLYEKEKFAANVYYASQFFDYAFFHRISKLKQYDSFQDSITDGKWNSFVVDDGCHFNEDGAKEEARWVYEKLKKNKLIS